MLLIGSLFIKDTFCISDYVNKILHNLEFIFIIILFYMLKNELDIIIKFSYYTLIS
jgi:hypothetical protein